MQVNTLDLAETAGGLVINYGATSYVGSNLRWNNATSPQDDNLTMDRRLWLGLIGTAASVWGKEGSLLQGAGRALGDGALNSLVATEALRKRLLAPGGGAPANQLPGGQGAPTPTPDLKGDLSGFWR